MDKGLLERAKHTLGKGSPETSVFSVLDDYFIPKPELMKHVITVQLIACIIVAFFLLFTAGQSLDSNQMMTVVVFFMLFLVGAVGVYARI
jgi:hypothetical protein